MIEAKDTVIKMKWMSIAVAKDQNALLLKQALTTWDIAFKAGEEQGIQKGRMKVVEWIEKMELYWRSISTTGRDYYIPLSLADTWQAFKKERGVMMAKTLKELIDERIDFLEEMASRVAYSSQQWEIQRGIRELEWVRRMMEDVRTQV